MSPSVENPLPHSTPQQNTCVVLVLLPVYNGERFLAPQIQSVLSQTGVQVFLMCRDDGSTDTSLDLLRAHQQRWPDHVHLIEDTLGNLGASGNFSRLMHAALAFEVPAEWAGRPCYVALSDQDDLWHRDKLATAVAAIQRLELAHPGQPALVHSDLRVIAEDGREIAPSMARYQGLQTQRSGFAAQLLSNTLTGCTSLLNRALLEKGLPVPPEAIMHDWWLSLVASSLGCRTYLDIPLIDYRQHASNAIGAKAQDKPVVFRSIIHRVFDDRHGDIFRLNARQAAAFLECFRPELTARQRFTLWLASHLALPVPPLQRLLYRVLRRL
jgi:glycosyltransferase involved in cell wall biosynthesis